jgi:DNA-directed RNA polymerase specialized sigma24 family protein
VNGLCILGYGRVGDLVAVRHARTVAPRQRDISRREVARFEAYARMLAAKYAYLGSGADEQDVEQTAIVAAWKALEEHNPRRGLSVEPFVKERMRFAVVSFVEMRTGQARLERRTIPLIEDRAPGQKVA